MNLTLQELVWIYGLSGLMNTMTATVLIMAQEEENPSLYQMTTTIKMKYKQHLMF